MSAQAHGGYRVEEADLARDGDAAVGVWRASLRDGAGRAAKLEWFYRAAPEGAHLQVLRPGTGHEVLGTAGVGWRRMRAGARTLRGGLLADMAVLPGHRTLGPAMQLQRAASDRALAEGDLVYGFPNANAVPVVKRLGYVHLGDMVLYVRALRHAPYLERRLPRPLATLLGRAIDTAFALRDRLRNLHRGALHAQWSEGPLDLVHPRWPRPGMLEGVRDRAALEWRFAHNPLAAFRFLYLRRAPDAQPMAWFVCRRDGDVLHIADFGFAPGAPVAHCVATLAREATARGGRSLVVECCLPDEERSALLRAGFRERQRRPIYARWRDPEQAARAVRFTSFDEDE
jgi:GNAT superfamily N-acetyltransferase